MRASFWASAIITIAFHSGKVLSQAVAGNSSIDQALGNSSTIGNSTVLGDTIPFGPYIYGSFEISGEVESPDIMRTDTGVLLKSIANYAAGREGLIQKGTMFNWYSHNDVPPTRVSFKLLDRAPVHWTSVPQLFAWLSERFLIEHPEFRNIPLSLLVRFAGQNYFQIAVGPGHIGGRVDVPIDLTGRAFTHSVTIIPYLGGPTISSQSNLKGILDILILRERQNPVPRATIARPGEIIEYKESLPFYFRLEVSDYPQSLTLYKRDIVDSLERLKAHVADHGYNGAFTGILYTKRPSDELVGFATLQFYQTIYDPTVGDTLTVCSPSNASAVISNAADAGSQPSCVDSGAETGLQQLVNGSLNTNTTRASFEPSGTANLTSNIVEVT